MNIFITGSTGFIGKHLKKRLQDFNIYCYKRDESVRHALAKATPDYIVHLAGEIYEDSEMFASNVELTHDLLKFSQQINYKSFIYIGSSSEYGRKANPMKETDFADPTNMYEATKACGTMLAQAYARRYKKTISILRPFSIYGPDDSPHKFIPTILRRLKDKRPINVSEGSHDFIHVDDFVSAIVQMFTTPSYGEIFNVCSGEQKTNMQIIKLFQNISDIRMNVREVPKLREYDSSCWVGENQKLMKTGWRITKPLHEGLRELYEEIT